MLQLIHCFQSNKQVGDFMSNRLTIRRKLLIGVLLATLIPFIIGIMHIKTSAETWLYENNLEQSKGLIAQTAARVDKSIAMDMQALSRMIAMDERVMSVDGGINRYVDYGTPDFKKTDTVVERQILSLFKSVVDTHETVAFVSLGTEYGGYIEYPEFKPNGPYDPRKRDWYVNALKANDMGLSEPYVTKVSKELVVSADSPVRKNGRDIGVVSMTVRLDSIMKEVARIKFGKTGHINIISPKGIIINSPHYPELQMKPYDDVGIGSYDSLKAMDGKSFEGVFDGVSYVYTVYVSPVSGWTYMASIEKSEVMAYSQSLSGLLAAILLVISAIIILSVSFIASYITRPIRSITSVIKHMSTFDFEGYEKNELHHYSASGDEIGEISRALESMQDNYMELSSGLSAMDEEIKGIDIENPDVAEVTLSPDNPLNGIARSVNVLLGKVVDYTSKINEFNKEITVKNEQLTASEEELIAQLDEINHQKEKINYLAQHDPLTDLPNRRNFMQHLRQTVQNGSHGAVILLDMDNFKSINDTLGHIFGDKVLQLAANRLVSLAGECILVSRFGGDEFLILLECGADVTDIQAFAEKIFKSFELPMLIDDNEVKVEFSMGISRFPEDSSDIEQIMMNADLALYSVKNSAKNNYAFFDDAMANKLKEKVEIKNILHKAIENDGFKMVYQPKVSLDDGAVVGYEALVRLKDHTLSPAVFIRAAEESGLIITLGRMVTRMVIQEMASLRDAGLKLKPMSINYSALQLADTEYAAFLMETLHTHGIAPSLIEIEVTEHVLMDDKELAVEFMRALREHGISIAVDDFGAEYSSLNYISSLPIDTLKLDREMNLMFLEREKPGVMEKLLGFLHSLDLVIVAEGIENMEHVGRLKASGCDIVQGYCFSRPVESHEIASVDGMIHPLE